MIIILRPKRELINNGSNEFNFNGEYSHLIFRNTIRERRVAYLGV